MYRTFSNDVIKEVLTEGDFSRTIEDIVKGAQQYVYFASAWVKGGMFRRIMSNIDTTLVDVRLIVRGSEKKDFEITDPSVFGIEGVKYAYHPSLHAKMIIVDGKKAIVGSANITYSGLKEHGNREVAIVIEDEEVIGELVSYFQTIWNESYEYSPNLVGMIMNPSRSSELEILLLRPSNEVPEGTLLVAPWDVDGDKQHIIMRVDSVIAYNTGFFLNPFCSENSHMFPNPSDITFVNDEDKPHAWRVGALLSYVEKSSNFYMARCSVLGVHRGGKLEPLFSAPPIGLPVYKDVEHKDSGSALPERKDGIAEMLMKDMSGGSMQMPVKVGRLYATDIPIYIDISYISRRDKARHMAILGTTGSGKSYFAQKILVPGILDVVKREGFFKDGFRIVVIDPHGEWAEKLKKSGVDVKEIKVPELNVPLWYGEESWQEFLSVYDIRFGGNDGAGKYNKRVFWEIRRGHRDESTYHFFLRELADVVNQFKDVYTKKEEKDISPHLANEIGDVLRQNADLLKRYVFEVLNEESAPVMVFNLSETLDNFQRTQLVGLIISLIFNQMKMFKAQRKDISTILVIEEAHNFAPEKGYGMVSTGKDNIALSAISKVAAEGRKFGLGMVIITQRPASVSKYVLSQMGTYAIFRLVNKNDLDAVVSAIEFAGADILGKLPSLKTGMALLSGLSLPFPVFVDMRQDDKEG